jgi:gamma-glutamylcyclotransferase (GGCT)/AIG2-like uncharacterized protein YtfP
MTSLFVYGTLGDPNLVQELIGRAPPTEPAQLRGFRRITPPGAYAYIVPAPGQVVHGLLLRDLDPLALATMDRYEDEGTLYRRTMIDVLVASGTERAWAYIGIPTAHPAVHGT